MTEIERREAAEAAAALLRETFPGMTDAELADMVTESNPAVYVAAEDADIAATAALDDPPTPSTAVLGAFFARKEAGQ